MDKGKCRGCGADILWGVTPTGTKVPLDAKPEKRFVLRVEGYRTYAVLSDTYQSHFVTCPRAGDFRKRKAPSARSDAPAGD